MEIVASKHAIRRYRQRLFDYVSSNDKIGMILEDIVNFGKRVNSRPSYDDNCFELRHKGVSVVAVYEADRVLILTCLGSMGYRKWIKKHNHSQQINGRILYPTTYY